MKLWLLAPKKEALEDKNSCWYEYDCVKSTVVVADTEVEARQKAADKAGQETREGLFWVEKDGKLTVDAKTNYINIDGFKEFNPWIEQDLTSCIELIASDYTGAQVIIQDICEG